MNWMSYSGGPIRLTFKEAARAKAGTCLVVRTQPNGTWLVAMVSTDSGMPVGEVCYVANPAEAEAAAKQLIDLRSSGGKQASLRAKVVRLAHAKPELRPHLLPLLAKTSAELGVSLTSSEAAIAKRLEVPFSGVPGTVLRASDDWDTLFSKAFVGKPIPVSAVIRVVKDAERLLKEWKTLAGSNGWTDKDKEDLAMLIKILTKALLPHIHL